MKKIGIRPTRSLVECAVVLFLLMIAATGSADSTATVEVESADGGLRVLCTITFAEEDLSFGRHDGRDLVSLHDAGSTGEAGKPCLPVRTVRIALPHGMRAIRVHLSEIETAALPGEYDVLPAQPPLPIGDPRATDRRAEPDRAVYASTEPYPPRVVELVGQADLAGQSVAVLRVHPVRYTPTSGKLTLTTSLTFGIEGVLGHECGDYLPARTSRRQRECYRRMLSGMVVNPRDVELLERSGGPSAPRGVPEGAFEYVIVTHDLWVDAFQPLADWRTQTGVPATIVTTDWIYTTGGYTGTNLEKIRAFVSDAHENWGTTDFLLGADTNVIPYHVRTITVPGYWTDDIPNDTWLADYDDDWICEVSVGRAPVRTSAAVAPFIDKIMAYEKDPPLTDYVMTAAFFGMDISVPGDGHGETAKEIIRGDHLPPSWTLATEYDSEPGTHLADMLDYLGTGYHLVNHHDHCNSTLMGAGWICHADLIELHHVVGLANGARQGILFCVGCNPADFPVHTSIGEAYVQNVNGGGVAHIGDTRTGWGGSGADPIHYTVMQDKYFYRNLFDDGFERIGTNFTDLKNDEYDPDDPYNLHQYCFTQLTLLGDPGMPVWTEDPRVLTVEHPGTAFAGQPAVFPVAVTSDGVPVDGATVCLWKGDDVYEVAETVSGTATVAFTPETAGTMRVTVCARNNIPYEGEATVTDDATSVSEGTNDLPRRLELVSIAPNPCRASTEIVYAVPATAGRSAVRLSIYNCAGKRVRTLLDGPESPGVRRVVWDGRDAGGLAVASGVYFCELSCREETFTRKIVRMR